MTIRVTEKKVYADRAPDAAETAAGIVYLAGQLKDPGMVDQKIRDSEHRKRIPSNQGNICISVLPGEKLGQMSFNVQFEGPYGEYDFCLKQHNELLLLVSEWVRDVMSELQSDFDVMIESDPCPKTERRVALDLAAQVLQGEKNGAQAINELSQRIEVATEVDIKHQQTGTIQSSS